MLRVMAGAARSWSRAGLVLTLYLALASAGVAWSSLRGDPSTWRLAGREDTQTLLGIVAGVLIGLGYVFASRLAVHRFEWARALHRDMRAMLGPLPNAEVVVLAVASALGEEIFFRGALLPAIGLAGSSLVFALLHVGPKLRFLPWTVSSFVAGLVFGQLFLWSGDLAGPVVAHFTVNFLNLRFLSAHEMR
jgi:membrane protease YdiL (CAAX protease family)